MSGQIKPPSLLRKLASRLAVPVPTAVRTRVGWHLLDWMGCAVAGGQSAAGRALLTAQISDDPLSDAFFWGGLGNIMEMDDVDKRALLHPGPSIIPAALAAASMHGASTGDLRRAIAVGYQATIGLGRAVGAGHYAKWHSTGTCGALGAAAASARLLGLNDDQTTSAMALAISQSAGLWHTRHDPDSTGKQVHTAVAARAGLHAALMARAGVAGPSRILEGPQGFFEVMCPDGHAEDVLRDIDDWFLCDVSFKPWAACRHAHAAIDAALLLRPDDGWRRAETIEIGVYGDAIKFCDRPLPTTVIEAKFSLQHAVAVTLLRGAPDVADFDMPAIRDPGVASLRQRVRVVLDDQADSRYPRHFGARIRVGTSEEFVPDALGDPENPLTLDQLIAKYRRLTDRLDAATQDVLLDGVLSAHDDMLAAGLVQQWRKVARG